MSKQFELVQAEPGHGAQVAALFDGYRQFYRQPADLAGARAFIDERLARQDSIIFLALEGRRGLGFTQLYPSFSSVSMRRLWILNDLFVAPEGRRRGVAEALLRRAQQFAREDGAKGLELATQLDNLQAQRLYERLGWLRDTEFYHYSWLAHNDGEGTD